MIAAATVPDRPTDPTRPEWLVEEPAVVRARVLRGDDAVAPPVDLPGVDLPSVDELADHHAAEQQTAEGDGNDGGAAITWALGYRKGYDEGRVEGFDAGHAAGRDAGHADATRAANARISALLEDLGREAARHLDQLDRVHRTIAAQATELAFAIAESVVARELTTSAEPGADAVRRALLAAPDGTEAVARLHPDDLAELSAGPAELAPDRVLRIVGDPTVERGGCVLRSGATTVDAGIAASLERVREALGLNTNTESSDTASPDTESSDTEGPADRGPEAERR